jgi:hypothetical protein
MNKKRGTDIRKMLLDNKHNLPKIIDSEREYYLNRFKTYLQKYPNNNIRRKECEFSNHYDEYNKYFYAKSYKTLGLITQCEKISSSEGSGFKVTIEYFDKNGVCIIFTDSSEMGLGGSNAAWEVYKDQRQINRNVIVLYHPEDTHLYEFYYPELGNKHQAKIKKWWQFLS